MPATRKHEDLRSGPLPQELVVLVIVDVVGSGTLEQVLELVRVLVSGFEFPVVASGVSPLLEQR